MGKRGRCGVGWGGVDDLVQARCFKLTLACTFSWDLSIIIIIIIIIMMMMIIIK